MAIDGALPGRRRRGARGINLSRGDAPGWAAHRSTRRLQCLEVWRPARPLFYPRHVFPGGGKRHVDDKFAADERAHQSSPSLTSTIARQPLVPNMSPATHISHLPARMSVRPASSLASRHDWMRCGRNTRYA
jgi:hypothetical protein